MPTTLASAPTHVPEHVSPSLQQHVDVERVEQLLRLNLDGVLTPPLVLKQPQQHVLVWQQSGRAAAA